MSAHYSCCPPLPVLLVSCWLPLMLTLEGWSACKCFLSLKRGITRADPCHHQATLPVHTKRPLCSHFPLSLPTLVVRVRRWLYLVLSGWELVLVTLPVHSWVPFTIFISRSINTDPWTVLQVWASTQIHPWYWFYSRLQLPGIHPLLRFPIRLHLGEQEEGEAQGEQGWRHRGRFQRDSVFKLDWQAEPQVSNQLEIV